VEDQVRYFCATVGLATEQQIKEYIENQIESPGTFKVWDEECHSEHNIGKLKSDDLSE
jgi:hypothetical protein